MTVSPTSAARPSSPQGRGRDAGSGHVLVFAVAETAAWEARLSAAGVAIDDRTAATLYVHDPDGHRVGLSVFGLI